mmetsp:Transcript_38112/g.61019  ORF Transcript_38112/g.61019 Transcript_38112/m.61019 type:complete len:322 (+) Transcript_38112:42-1007(+)|eukprot:CAMPEP_0197053430 /NCGR_PEP_ID=MMETSP1384-20130603/27708_1 /TAXON_ID=29189 /ORGANISM="Ammonia sp." /LENGTH=321 /DNA_ID=CAMNT_0042486327 /DNA_START=29 /DNA_END=994 /DNA_ORIENTATION=-
MSHSEQKAELVTAGYVHQHSPISIPLALTGVIQVYYDPYQHIHFVNARLNAFLQCQNNQDIDGKCMAMHGCHFKASFNPNGWDRESQGYVGYFIELTYMPPTVQYIFVSIELLFPATNAKCMFSRRFEQLDECGWPAQTLPLETCQRFGHLVFDYKLDVKHIKYKCSAQQAHLIGDFAMKKLTNYQYLVAPHVFATYMEDGRIAPNMHVSMDQNWLFSMQIGAQNEVLLAVQILDLPLGVNEMVIAMRIKGSGASTIDMSACARFGVCNTLFDVDTGLLIQDIAQNSESILFDITLDVKAVYDDSMQCVAPQQWNELNIIV